MEKIRLGDVVEISNGFAFKSKNYTNNGIRIIRIANVQKGYIEDTSPVFYPKNSKGIERYMLKKDDLLVSLTGNVGRVAILNEKFLPAALNQRVACLRVKTNKITKDYLFHFLNSNYFEQQCISASKGVAQKNISTKWLRTCEIPLYPKEKQFKIGEILGKLRNIKEAKMQEIEQLNEMVKARFVEMFGNPVSNPYGWKKVKLSELGTLARGKSKHRPRNAPELLGGPYPLIQAGDVAAAGLYITECHNTYSELGLRQSRMWKAGTLCITIAANIAQTAIMTFDACFPDSVVGFVPVTYIGTVYMHYWFSFFQKILEEQAPQVAQKNINLKILSDLSVIVPPQERISAFNDFVRQVNKSKFALINDIL